MARTIRRSKQKQTNGKLLQLLACTMLFLTAVVIRTFELGGEDMKNRFLNQLEYNIDLRETVETLGRAITVPSVQSFKEESSPLPVQSIPEQTIPEIEPETEVNISIPSDDGVVSVMGTLPEEEPTESEAIISDDGALPPPDIVYTGSVDIPFDYITPVAGRITSKFGYRDHPVDGEYKFHYGIDVAADTGTPILCFADGEVTFVGVGEINGNYMKVTHSDGFVTMYAHCDSINVKVGDKVKVGQKIASAGATGTVSGSHLHFQIYSDGKLIDPALYLEGLTWA